MLTINDEAWRKFIYNRYTPSTNQDLTKTERKVYNMLNVGYPVESIATRLKTKTKTITRHIKVIQDKGWLK